MRRTGAFGQNNAPRPGGSSPDRESVRMPARLTRRTFHRAAAGSTAGALIAAASPSGAAAAEQLGPHHPRMMQGYYEAKLPGHAARVAAEIAAVDSPESAAAHAAEVRAKLALCFEPKPERTPLNATVTGTLERDGYRIELLTYESRPGLLVTANLYLPEATAENPGPHPGVLGVCGHSTVGKADEKYQAFCVELARAGFATLILDPIGQGERFQWPKGEPARGKGGSEFGGTVGEHNQLDRLMRPTGQWFGSWRAWDGVRGIDLLAERDDVSIEPFLGVTGNSGGGTLTCLVSAWDDRVSAAAPSCYVTTLARNLRNELPADAEQCPPRMLALGMDHHSFLVPTLLGGGRTDPSRTHASGSGHVTILSKRADFFDVPRRPRIVWPAGEARPSRRPAGGRRHPHDRPRPARLRPAAAAGNGRGVLPRRRPAAPAAVHPGGVRGTGNAVRHADRLRAGGGVDAGVGTAPRTAAGPPRAAGDERRRSPRGAEPARRPGADGGAAVRRDGLAADGGNPGEPGGPLRPAAGARDRGSRAAITGRADGGTAAGEGERGGPAGRPPRRRRGVPEGRGRRPAEA